jgi:hypothetical protein
MLIGEFLIIENPLEDDEGIVGTLLSDTQLVIYGNYSWALFNMKGKQVGTVKLDCPKRRIFLMDFISETNYYVYLWNGDGEEPDLTFKTVVDGTEDAEVMSFHRWVKI